MASSKDPELDEAQAKQAENPGWTGSDEFKVDAAVLNSPIDWSKPFDSSELKRSTLDDSAMKEPLFDSHDTKQPSADGSKMSKSQISQPSVASEKIETSEKENSSTHETNPDQPENVEPEIDRASTNEPNNSEFEVIAPSEADNPPPIDQSATETSSPNDQDTVITTKEEATQPDPSKNLVIVPTPGDGHLCGLHALCLSIEHQHPTITPPTLKQLQGAATVLNPEDASYFNDEQLVAILHKWSLFKGYDLRLGIVIAGEPSHLMPGTSNQKVVWAHKNTTHQPVHDEQVPPRWSGMVPAPGHDTPPSAPVEQENNDIEEPLDMVEVIDAKESLMQPDDLATGALTTGHELLDSIFSYVIAGTPQGADKPNDDNEKRHKSYAKPSPHNVLLSQRPGMTLPAVYFKLNGQHLIPESDQYVHHEFFSIKHDRHMPCFLAHISGQSLVEANFNSVSKDNEESNVKPELTCLQDSAEVLEDLGIFEGGYLEQEHSIRDTSQIRINYAALNHVAWVDMAVENKDTDQQELISLMSAPVRDYIKNRLVIDGLHPILVKIIFDINTAAKYHIYLNEPNWAKSWTSEVKTGALLLVIDGDKFTTQRLEGMRSLLELQKETESPLNQFYDDYRKHHVYSETHIDVSKIKSDNFHYQPRVCFNSLDEYFTVQAVSILSNRYAQKENMLDWNEAEFKLRLSAVSNTEGHSYLGWFDLPRGLEWPRPGTTIKVTFPTGAEEWIAGVSEAIVGPYDMVPVTISRPWNSKTGFSNEIVHVIPTNVLTKPGIATAIARDLGNKIRMQILPQLKVSIAQLGAIIGMNTIKKNRPEYTQFNKDILIALVGSDVHTLKPRDIFEDVRDKFDGDVTLVMDLNPRQKQAVKAMASAPGGLSFVHGPLGTSKSKLVVEICKPFLMSQSLHQILVVSPTNIGADILAKEIQDGIQKLHEKKFLHGDGYIIRAYTPSAERAILDIQTGVLEKHDTSKKQPNNIQGTVEWKLLDEATALFKRSYIDENTPVHADKFKALEDKRVRSPELATTTKMLEVIGFNKGPNTCKDRDLFASLRVNIGLYAKGMTKTQDTFNVEIQDAMQYTIQNASVIVTTTDYAGLKQMALNIEPSCRLLICDDSLREKEVSYLPIFFSRANLNGAVFMGDLSQSPHTGTTSTTQNVYSEQTKISFMFRMMHLGLPYTELGSEDRIPERL